MSSPVGGASRPTPPLGPWRRLQRPLLSPRRTAREADVNESGRERSGEATPRSSPGEAGPLGLRRAAMRGAPGRRSLGNCTFSGSTTTSHRVAVTARTRPLGRFPRTDEAAAPCPPGFSRPATERARPRVACGTSYRKDPTSENPRHEAFFLQSFSRSRVLQRDPDEARRDSEELTELRPDGIARNRLSSPPARSSQWLPQQNPGPSSTEIHLQATKALARLITLHERSRRCGPHVTEERSKDQFFQPKQEEILNGSMYVPEQEPWSAPILSCLGRRCELPDHTSPRFHLELQAPVSRLPTARGTALRKARGTSPNSGVVVSRVTSHLCPSHLQPLSLAPVSLQAGKLTPLS
ncbi:uncharacterized protein LOC114006578 [Tupaia chinensis]|uniref:uncharacterized protein LOC114006578 n=1 Tax=Tupaia chinensis TaxID=246437 RepID=UPI000FFC60DD|nr:uncharacterized protein LOC114006578 [Tupaia chinensis]